MPASPDPIRNVPPGIQTIPSGASPGGLSFRTSPAGDELDAGGSLLDTGSPRLQPVSVAAERSTSIEPPNLAAVDHRPIRCVAVNIGMGFTLLPHGFSASR